MLVSKTESDLLNEYNMCNLLASTVSGLLNEDQPTAATSVAAKLGDQMKNLRISVDSIMASHENLRLENSSLKGDVEELKRKNATLNAYIEELEQNLEPQENTDAPDETEVRSVQPEQA